MSNLAQKSARIIAARVLTHFDLKRDYVSTVLSKLLDHTNEKQRATDLVFGTIRNRFVIDNVISRFADCPVERIQSKLLNIIRIASFELIYNPQTPEYSVLNEAVNTAKAIAGKKQTAFVNAVLRQITRHIKERQVPLSQAENQRTLPQNLSTGCQFDTDILPDPEGSPADYLSLAFSLPKWLVVDWLSEFSEEQVRQICFASNRRPSIYIRPNILKTTAEEIAEKLQKADIDCEIVPNVIPAQAGIQKSSDADDSMIRIKSPKAITKLPGFKQGLFTVQDVTASLPVRLLNTRPEWTILDLCAAPGTKTTQLAELTGDSAKIIATDIDPQRLKSVKENIARLGITRVDVLPYEEILNSKFDCILLDVPCSNIGVLAKRIEARYRINPKAIEKLTKTQNDLLGTAAKMLKPNGRICYSTCSIQKAENSECVRDFLRRNPGFELESELLTLPSAEGFDRDGGYVAVITRK
jgi:16S rRNA (cytosine967-C5)-methyltransferase